MAKKEAMILLAVIIAFLLVHSVAAASRSFRVQETDFVTIKAEAIDPDNDKITYNFSAPLDEKGEWQTDYDDAGTYNITITASDGKTKTEQTIILVVDNKNQAPIVTQRKITVNETQSIDLKTAVKDLDLDPLSYVFQLPFNKNGIWTTTVHDAGIHATTVMMSDGELTTDGRIEIEVLPINQPPEIKKTFSDNKIINVKENQTFIFFVNATDPDTEELAYQWKLDTKVIGDQEKGEYYFDFDTAGEHALEVTIKDKTLSITKDWTITVENTNRKPGIIIPPFIAKEGEKVMLNLPERDQDGDWLIYTYPWPFNNQSVWETNLQDAGKYTFTLDITDKETTIKKSFNVTIINVDIPPSLTIPSKIYGREGELLVWNLETKDTDNDNLTINITTLPAGAVVDQQNKIFSWRPSYDTIQRRGGMLSNILNAFRLEQLFLRSKKVPVEIKVCGKELCRKGTATLVIYNQNRAPSFSPLNTTIGKEMEKLILSPLATDPDGDIVHYYFSEPLHRRKGIWTPSYSDEGDHTVFVTATDGKNGATVSFNIKILNKNRAPTLLIENDERIINEGDKLQFAVKASDPDNDTINIVLQNPPFGSSFKEGIFSWQLGYDIVINNTNEEGNEYNNSSILGGENGNERTLWLKFIGSDKEFNVTHPVKITIRNENRAPQIVATSPGKEITAHVNEPVLFEINAVDEDNDSLQYEWSFSWHESDVENTNRIERTFITPGIKKVNLQVSDGTETVERQWTVTVLEQEYVAPTTILEEAVFRVYVVEK